MKKVILLLACALTFALTTNAKSIFMDNETPTTQSNEQATVSNQTAAPGAEQVQDLTEEMRYNIDSDGMITELGYESNYEFAMEPDSPVNFVTYWQYRRVGGGGIGNGYWQLIE